MTEDVYKDVYIVSVARTPIGSFNGSLASVSAPSLGATAIKAAIERSGIPLTAVNECIFGNVLSAGLGQAPARQAALLAGLSQATPCTTVNKVCASGMKALMLGAQQIQLGLADVIVVGGMENMSQVPYYSSSLRFGSRLGNVEMTDGLIKDGLWDVYKNCHMGDCAEKCAKDYSISREDQDNFSIESYRRAIAATQQGKFLSEICSVEIPGKRGSPSTFIKDDEELKKYVGDEKIKSLRPAFNGPTVTAGNASSLSDGAAAIVLASAKAIAHYACTPIAKIRGYADAAQAPEDFTTAPSLAVPIALKRSGLTIADVDFIELNEAFSVVGIVNAQLLGISPSKCDVYGGAVAIGHPLGCSGARIIVTLCSILQQEHGRIGVAAICNGGGGAFACVLERAISNTSAL